MKILIVSAISLSLIACGGTTSSTSDANVDAADIVFVNGEIYAGNVKNPWASAVAIDGEHIVFVGDNNNAQAFVGPDTKTYDLGGKLVIPGMIDAHAHPGATALEVGRVRLDAAVTKEELFAAVGKMVQENPDRDILLGGFWRNELFDVTGPHKRELDAIESQRPVILFDDWIHTVWVNSAALAQAGVTRDTKDIVPGFSFYQKDDDGEPTGWITESAASVFVNKFQPVTPSVESSLLEYLNEMRDIGVTTVLDAGNFGLDDPIYAVVSRLDQDGRLPVRYHGAYTLFLPDDFPTAVGSLKALGEKYNSDRVRIDTLKIFFDGVLETRTAALSSDYLDTPGNKGAQLLSREQIHTLILELDREGLNLHVHSVGDRATTTILDAIEDAHDTLLRAPNIRIAISHLEIVKDEDFSRFKELGVIAQFTPHWGTGGDYFWYEQGIGAEAYNMMRAQPLISDGAVVTFSSDVYGENEWKTDRANPFLGMQVGHNRQDIEGGPDAEIAFPQSERLQRDDLVNGYTSNAAHQLGRSDELGSIAVGYRTDLVVLDQNLFEVDRYDIHKTKPVAVVMDGEIVSGSL